MMSSEVTRIEALILVSVFPVLEVLCYVLLCVRRSDLAVRKRGINLVCFASIAGWLAYLNLIFSATDRGGTCAVLYVFSVLIPPIAAGSQLTRAINLRAKLERSSILLEEERIHGKTRRRGSQSQSERAPPEKNALVVAGGGVAGVQATLPISPSTGTSTRTGSLYIPGREKITRNIAETKSLLKMVRWLLLYVPTAFLLLATLSDPRVSGVDARGVLGSSTCSDCYAAEPIYVLYICPALALFVAMLTLVTTTLIRSSEDKLGIRSEITRNAIIIAISYLAILIARLAGRRDLRTLFEAIQQLLLCISMKLMPCFHRNAESLLSWATKNGKLQVNTMPGYALPLPKVGGRRNSLRRNSAKDIESDNERRRELSMSLDAGLCVLLSTQDGIDSFSEHCVREFSYENIRFWCAINDFHAEVDLTCVENGGVAGDASTAANASANDAAEGNEEKLSEAEILDYAKSIFGTYIASTGELQINIPSALVAEIKKAVESDRIRRDVFDKAQQEIFSLMSRDSYPRYLAARRKRPSVLGKSMATRKSRVSATGAK